MLFDSNGGFSVNIETVNWKNWKCKSHIDGSGNIIIDDWFSSGTQPTPSEISQANIDYEQHLIDQPIQDQADFSAMKTKVKNKLGITTQAEWKKFRKLIKWIAENKGD